MNETTETITYTFLCGLADEFEYSLEVDAGSWLSQSPACDEDPAWTQLSHHQCEHCPLDSNETHCPLARQLATLTPHFENLNTHDGALIRVFTKHRIYEHTASIQQGLSSLLGLIFATSACPHLKFFRPMARFHLPFASSEETLFRVFATFALHNIMADTSGLIFQMEDLRKLYQNLHIINQAMSKRIQSVMAEDSTAHAVVLLDILSKSMLYSIEGAFEEFRRYFHMPET